MGGGLTVVDSPRCSESDRVGHFNTNTCLSEQVNQARQEEGKTEG